MQYIIKELIFACIFLFFSVIVFSQTTKPSDHPLLDKYYPQKQKADPPEAVINAPTAAPPPVKQLPVVVAKPLLPKPEPPKPAIDTAEKYAPSTTVSQIPITSTSGNTLSTTKAITAIQKPAVQNKPTAAKQPALPYIDTRLGSSAPQYNTYEKNSYGAGSVTTSPK